MKDDGAFGALRNVIESFAADGRDRRGRAEHDQHLFLRRAERDLLERAFGQHIAALKRFAEAPGERRERAQNQRAACRCPSAPALHKITPHPHLPCVRPASALRPKPGNDNPPLDGALAPPPRGRANPMILPPFRRDSDTPHHSRALWHDRDAGALRGLLHELRRAGHRRGPF